jgi:DNA invertase Pin-like site-specific DNA recombinase
MATSERATRAAQYVRMSTDYQQYSTLNQKAAIAAYAEVRGIEVVATYEDVGKSGLTFSGRPALRQLIADVSGEQHDFGTILVYDVSRWGRFQDADESAHLEYLCRLGGVRIEYCAEPFTNDGTPFASICKVVKRALAAEYSRELSDKVFKGQKRLIELGFRLGGSPGIGLRRCLIDAKGKRKGILAPGERKNITTDRVILVPGPRKEIKIVQRIYRDYVKRAMGDQAIAEQLNLEGIPSETGRPWSKAMIKRILTAEKYIGDSVWARSSFKLKIAREHNPPHTWARHQSAFEGIVNHTLFKRAQEERARRNVVITDEQIVAHLKVLLRQHGKLTARLIRRDGFFCVAGIRKRFGSLITAYELAGYQPSRDLTFLKHHAAAQRLRATTAQGIIKGLQLRGEDVERLSGACRFLVNGELRVTVTVVQQRKSQREKPRWLIKPGLGDADLRIAVLADGRSDSALAYYFFPSWELRRERLLCLQNAAELEVFRSYTLEPLFNLCSRCQMDLERIPIGGSRDVSIATPSSLPALFDKEMQRTRLPAHSSKTYIGAHRMAVRQLRLATDRAAAVHLRLDVLRELFLSLLARPDFVARLAKANIRTVPYALYRPPRQVLEMQELRFRQKLSDEAAAFLSGKDIARRAKRLLSKLKDKWRLEAAEIILLRNDRSEQFARALVASTPRRGLRSTSTKHVYGADPKLLKSMVRERESISAKAKPALAAYGRDALDLVAAESFMRRILELPPVVSWLRGFDRAALRMLSLVE